MMKQAAVSSSFVFAFLFLVAGLPAQQPGQRAAQPKPEAAAKATKPGAGSDKKDIAREASPAKQREIDPLDWPMWRGPEQNGISRETGISTKWDPKGGEGSNLLWKSHELGGISTPIVMRGKLYSIVRADPETAIEGEKVICVNAETGEKIWENRFNVYLSDVPAERVGWSSVVGDPTTGRVYALGVSGYFLCADGETGKTIWSRSLHEEFGLLSTYGGRTNFPVVYEDMVIISAVVIGWGDMARPAHRFIAFDKATGVPRWFNGTKPLPEDTTYSTPFLGVLGGQAAMVFGSGDGGLWAFQPRTGKPIWNFQMSRRGMDAPPMIHDDVVYMSQAQENIGDTSMGSVVAVDGKGSGDITKSGKIWMEKNITAGKGGPLLIDGRLYIPEESGRVHIFDAKTGERIGKPIRVVGSIVRSSPVYADGKIFHCSTTAFHVMEPTEDGLKFITKMRLPAADEVTASPIISHGRLYITSTSQMYCIGLKDHKVAATERPAPPTEDAVGKNDKPAQVQVVPCELLLSPGEKQELTVRLFNDRGQFLRESKAEFSVQGPGEIDDSGVFHAASDAMHSAAIVTAKVGEITGQARIRIVPPLPWKFTFDNIQLAPPMGGKAGAPEGEPPITWVGARYRHKVRDVDGERVMVKVTTIPKGTRSQSWMGPIDLHDYTIQADLQAAAPRGTTVAAEEEAAKPADEKLPEAQAVSGEAAGLPDMGLIAQRYTIDMMGASQQLQIRSWPPQVATNFSKTIPFTWRPGIWYTVKFRASVEGDKAVLRGKVWPREEQEPTEWTIEAAHDVPNTHGSPGLFGNSTNAEIYIDNITVTPNESRTRAVSKR